MNNSKMPQTIDLMVAGLSIVFLFGCIASSLQTAKTLEPKRASLAVDYQNITNLENEADDNIKLAGIAGRFGIYRGIDVGFAHTFDLSKPRDIYSTAGMYSTYWGDVKFQLTNLDNALGTPTLAIGLKKGYIYHKDAQYHNTSVPIHLSLPINEYFTASFQYRYEIFTRKFVPEKFPAPRSIYSLGLELNLVNDQPNIWAPKMGFAVGYFNSLKGGLGVDGLIVNFGLQIATPVLF